MPSQDDLARRRARALADAKKTAAGYEARLDDLRDDVADAEYRAEIAENAVAAVTVHGAAYRPIYMPGDEEPKGHRVVLASLSGGGIFHTNENEPAPADSRWRQLGYGALPFRWQAVLASAPLIEITGPGADAALTTDSVAGGAR